MCIKWVKLQFESKKQRAFQPSIISHMFNVNPTFEIIFLRFEQIPQIHFMRGYCKTGFWKQRVFQRKTFYYHSVQKLLYIFQIFASTHVSESNKRCYSTVCLCYTIIIQCVMKTFEILYPGTILNSSVLMVFSKSVKRICIWRFDVRFCV